MTSKYTVLTTILGLGLCGLSTAAWAAEKNPARNPAAGRETFREYCSVCHGMNGKGNGPAAEALKTAPSDLTTLSQRNGGKFPDTEFLSAIHNTRKIPAHGTPDMPIWGDVFRNVHVQRQKVIASLERNLTAYVESLQAGK